MSSDADSLTESDLARARTDVDPDDHGVDVGSSVTDVEDPDDIAATDSDVVPADAAIEGDADGSDTDAAIEGDADGFDTEAAIEGDNAGDRGLDADVATASDLVDDQSAGQGEVSAASHPTDEVTPDPDADSPFGDELRLPDEHGYDGEFVDEDFVEAFGDADDPGLDEWEGEAVLFDGDPDEFELDVLGAGFSPAARPQSGDVLVLDDAAGHTGPPPVRRMSRLERRRRVRLQARRVRRIIRHIEPWSVLKISIFFYACLWVIFLVAGFMIWGVAESSGTVDKVESLILELFALDSFDFDAGQIFRGYALGGLALAIAGTTFNVLMCLLFNLISDLTGGLRITMIEEESARPIPPRRRRRRPPARR